MQKLIAVIVLLLSTTFSVEASEFNWMVREFARESGAKPIHIPFFGLARFVVAVGHPAGASQLNLAVFEHPSFDAPRFSELTDSLVGMSWKPIVRVRSTRGESTNIYAQQDQKELRVLVTALDGGEATFVQVKIKPEVLIRFVDAHQHRYRP